jgi:hypothetical protein
MAKFPQTDGKDLNVRGIVITDLHTALMDSEEVESYEDADKVISELHDRMLDGEDPSEMLLDEFSLEPDYVMDIINYRI